MRRIMRKLGKVLKYKNFTNLKFVFLADCKIPFFNKHFDSFDEAKEYGNKVQQLKRLYGGYNVYEWRHDKYVRVFRWEELN